MAHDAHEDPQRLELLRVCRIGRAQGLKGEVTVQSFTDEPEERFAPGSTLLGKDTERRYVVAASRTFKNRWILRFEGVENRDDAEALNGFELYGRAEDPERMAEDDEWYPKDLIGLEARLSEPNMLGIPGERVLGKVVDVIDGPQSLLKIRLDASLATADERTALVPFVEALVPCVDLGARYLTIDPPGGLIPGLQ